MALVIALGVLNLVLLLVALAGMWRLRRQLIRMREIERMERRLESPKTLWAQFESMTKLYRLLDGKADLPSLRNWAVSPDFLLHVVRHIQERAPKTILECGSGSSTIATALALRTFGIDGHVYSIENYEPSVAAVRKQLRRHDLERFVTLVFVPMVEKRYDGAGGAFEWYDLRSVAIPDDIDLLVVDGPVAVHKPDARYPAGPELLHKLAPDAHVFIDDAGRPGEQAMVERWRGLYPNLTVRELPAEKGCLELSFLNEGKSQAQLVSAVA